MKTGNQSLTSGFSLVEVSLALLVIGLGLLAVFGLFPSGLSMNKRSIDETQCAMFANDVFDAFRGILAADPNLWSEMGTGNDPGLRPTAESMWKDGGTVQVVSATADFLISVYSNRVSGMAENAWRYKLTFGNVNGRIKYANLQILHGEYGRSNNIQEFYTEYYNFRSPRYP